MKKAQTKPKGLFTKKNLDKSEAKQESWELKNALTE